MNIRLAACSLVLPLMQTYAVAADRHTEDLADTVAGLTRVGSVTSPSYSPDGTQIAFVSDLNGIPQAWIIPSVGGYPQLVTSGTDPVASVRWSPKDPDMLAYLVAPGGGMNTQVYVVHPDGTHLRRLTAGGKDNNTLVDWTHDGKHLMVGSNQRDAAAVDPYMVDPTSGQMERLEEAGGINLLEDVSRDGTLGLVSRMISRSNNNVYLLNLKSRTETLITPHDGPGRFNGQLGADGRTVYLLSNKDHDLTVFARVRLLQDGKAAPIEVVAARKDAELENFRVNEQGSEAALIWNVAGRSELDFVDLLSGKSMHGPELPAELVRGLAFSPNGRQLALALTGPQAPSDLWVLNMDTKNLTQLTLSPHAGVDLAQLVRPELVTFKAHDGLQLSGWLYQPQGQRAPAPYVLVFHGGPEGQERPTFRSDFQALLSQGIGVFAPNVRGSGGFGKRFENLDNGPLRINSIKDIKASADYLVSSGRADPARLGIAGGSYGGYMTMAGITEYPNLFAAAVNLFGIVNFATFFAHTEPWMASVSTVKYGDPVRDAAMLRELSPIHKLDRIKAALMVQHGANDTNVPVVEAEQIVSALQARNAPVEYILFPDEGHGFRKTGNRVRSTVSMVDFFVRYLRPAAPSNK